ncbi:hypothetical protein, partial [Corynebacterium heidelbergense]
MDRQADPHANPEPTGHAAAPRDHGSNLAAATGRSGTGDLPHRSGSEPYFDEDFASHGGATINHAADDPATEAEPETDGAATDAQMTEAEEDRSMRSRARGVYRKMPFWQWAVATVAALSLLAAIVAMLIMQSTQTGNAATANRGIITPSYPAATTTGKYDNINPGDRSQGNSGNSGSGYSGYTGGGRATTQSRTTQSQATT